jgi:hypothetical protein
VSDGSLGAIVLWEDYRAGPANADVYGKRVGLLGSLPNYWGTNGIPVSNAGCSQQFVAAAVGTNPIVLWQDGRSANRNIYAQRVEVQGTLGMNGPSMMSAQPASGFESDHVWLTWFASPLDAASPSGRIGSYRVWRDRLSKRVEPAAAGVIMEGRAIESVSAIAPSRGIGPGSSEFPAEAPGAAGAHEWELVTTVSADGSSAYSIDVALPASPPASPGYGLFFVEAIAADDAGITWPSAIFEAFPSTSPDPTGVLPERGARATELDAPRPNPVSAEARFHFALADERPVELAIFGVDGRRIRVLVRGAPGVGRHEIAWDRSTSDGRRVPGGVYFVRLESAGRRLVRRISVVP